MGEPALRIAHNDLIDMTKPPREMQFVDPQGSRTSEENEYTPFTERFLAGMNIAEVSQGSNRRGSYTPPGRLVRKLVGAQAPHSSGQLGCTSGLTSARSRPAHTLTKCWRPSGKPLKRNYHKTCVCSLTRPLEKHTRWLSIPGSWQPRRRPGK